MDKFIGILDQKITTTRFAIFDHDCEEFASCGLAQPQIRPRPGWIEQDPAEIWECAQATIDATLRSARLALSDLAAIGITNQVETTVVWNRRTGLPYGHAIGWQDLRTAELAAALAADGRDEVIHHKTGLVPNPHFSATKIQWILEEAEGAREDAERGDAIFGTIDSWLLWNLTGGVAGGQHLTDVTNASRTMLMDLATLDWDEELLSFFDVPPAMLAPICPSSRPDSFGLALGGPRWPGVAVTSMIGESAATAVGHQCLTAGQAYCNCADRNLVQFNVGSRPVTSASGLVTTVAYQFAGQEAMYALEGRVSFTGGAIRWLADALGTHPDPDRVVSAASEIADADGLYFVPAFTGLEAPDRRPDARGAVIGLQPWHTREHLARATVDSVAYRMSDLVGAMERESGVELSLLRVDGPGANADACLQMQANLLGAPVMRGPAGRQLAARGAGFLAGLAAGYWEDVSDLPDIGIDDKRWPPEWTEEQRSAAYAQWRRAVARTHA